jgi:hypothetical protein
MTESSTFDEAKAKSAASAMRQSCYGLSDIDSELDKEREIARDYLKGDMSDLPVEIEDRSEVVDTFGADVIESTIPDLIEIFTDEDVVAFDPLDEEDVEQARLETEFIRYVIYQKNKGWLHLFTAFRDALEQKLGVWKYWGEESVESKEEVREGVEAAAVPHVADGFAKAGYNVASEETSDGVFRVTATKETRTVIPMFKPVASGDFGTSNESICIYDNDYCVERITMRRQDAAEMFGEDAAAALTIKHKDDDDQNDRKEGEERKSDLPSDLHEVEVYEHYIRTDLDGEGVKLWQLFTNADETVLLDHSQADRMPYGVITPFISPHETVGSSMMDKCIELQRIRTVLLRAVMDMTYFGLNQRAEISDADANEYTESDYVDNSPGSYVRSKTGNAINPITSSGIGYDPFAAFEFVSTLGEERTGVGRQTQGLNSDALHDTATGQSNMMSRAQRRLRMIARSFAETGFRDLCLGLHAIIRESGMSMSGYVSGKIVNLEPDKMRERDDLRITVGGGSREEALAALNEVRSLAGEIVSMQGGIQGPVMDLTGIHTVLTRYVDMLPVKGLRNVFISPNDAEMPEPEESPEVVKAQADIELEQMKFAHEKAMDEARLLHEMEMDKVKAQAEAELAREKQQREMALAVVGGAMPSEGYRPGGRLDR